MKKTIIVILVSGTLLFVLWKAFYNSQSHKIGYIETTKLFNEFLGKKEIEKLVLKEQQHDKIILDSLYLNLSIIKQKMNSGDHSPLLQKEYQDKDVQFRKFNEEIINKIEEKKKKNLAQIWNQLNTYVFEYGKENKYEFIYGADGSGAIMYADSSKNVTQDLIKYANEKYSGH